MGKKTVSIKSPRTWQNFLLKHLNLHLTKVDFGCGLIPFSHTLITQNLNLQINMITARHGKTDVYFYFTPWSKIANGKSIAAEYFFSAFSNLVLVSNEPNSVVCFLGDWILHYLYWFYKLLRPIYKNKGQNISPTQLLLKCLYSLLPWDYNCILSKKRTRISVKVQYQKSIDLVSSYVHNSLDLNICFPWKNRNQSYI